MPPKCGVRVLAIEPAPAVYADEAPLVAGGTRFVHLACTAYPDAHAPGDRSSGAIDADDVLLLPGYSGVIVRDGYCGYDYLTDALYAWRGTHLLRDLKGLYDFELGK